MNDGTVKNWIAKAENNLKTAKDESKTENPATDTICFHSQQCAEKYLKAYLIYHGKEFRKTHDIAELIETCKEIDEDFKKLYEFGIEKLTDYAVDIRYGEEFYSPTIEETKSAIDDAEKVKDFILKNTRKRIKTLRYSPKFNGKNSVNVIQLFYEPKNSSFSKDRI